MLRNLLIVGAAAISLAAPSLAQNIRLVGTVTQTSTGYGLLNSSVELVSAGVDLSQHVGDDLDMTGALVAGSNPPRVGIETEQNANSWLRLQGNPRLGGRFVMRIDDQLATEYYTFLSLGEGFLPLDPIVPVVHGTLFLDLATTLTVAWGFMQNSWRQEVPIPNDPGLVGVRLRFQSAVMQSPGHLLYINPAQLVIGT